MKRILSSIGSVRRTFKDTFSRADGSLDRASDGSKWNILRGTWNISSNRLTTSTSVNNYPIATVNTVSQDVDISIKNVSQGATAALWVTDSGNWWGVGIDQAAADCNCDTCANYVTNSYVYSCGFNYCSGPNCPGSTCAAWSCSGGSSFTCNSRVCNQNCKSWTNQGGQYRCANYYGACCLGYYNPCPGGYNVCSTWNNAFSGYNNCVGYSTNISGYYNCNCQTCYPQYVRLIQSVANTVSTIATNSVSVVANSLKILVRKTGDNSASITVKPYSDDNFVTQIGSDIVYTPLNVSISSSYGIIVKPSSYSQGTTVGEIEITSI